LGWAYHHKGDYALAAPLFEDAVKSMANSHEGQDRAGKAISIDPKSDIAQRARPAISENPVENLGADHETR
jgi:hypothetical protein